LNRIWNAPAAINVTNAKYRPRIRIAGNARTAPIADAPIPAIKTIDVTGNDVA
jgi:hypothetical protein